MRLTRGVRTRARRRLTRDACAAVSRHVTEGARDGASKPRSEMSTSLAIGDVAEQTGIAAGTIRMWEQRYGFPEPDRTASGYRRYSEDDVEALRRVAAYRRLGLSIPAAIDRVRASG